MIDAICQHLEAVTDGRINRLLINVPPGSMKSLLVSVLWPAWEWGPKERPSLRYISTTYSENYSLRDSRRMRDLVDSDWYKALWPNVVLTRRGERSFANTQTGTRDSRPFSGLTGGRADRVIIDDPNSTEGAESQLERETSIRIFRESVPSRVIDPKTSAIVIIMQRLHEQDVSGQAIALKLGYVHLCLPMEFEPEARCVTSIGFVDPRRYDGELLFPGRFPREVVDRDKHAMTAFAVAGQFQQRPAPRDGALFKRHWFTFVPALPAGFKATVRGWDLAASKGRGAFTAGVKLSRIGNYFYIEHSVRDRLTPGEVEQLVKNTASQDGTRCRISIPQDPGQAAISQKQSFAALLAGYEVRFSAESGDKIARANPVSAQAEVGNMKILRQGEMGDPRDAWIEPFLDELMLFPGGMYKDQVDALSRAFAELIRIPPEQKYALPIIVSAPRAVAPT